MSLADYISSRNIPLIAAAGVLGVTVLGLTSRLFKSPSSLEIVNEEEDDTVILSNHKSILSEETTRPSSVIISRTPSPQQSPVMYVQRGSIPRNEGDSLFFQILESYAGGRNSVISPGLTTSSGASTPSLDPSVAGANQAPHSGRRKRRSKNSAKKRSTVITSN